MDDWEELKKIAKSLCSNLEYKQAAEQYVTALQSLVENNFTECDNNDPCDDHSLGLKTEAAKICSNISLMYFKVWETNGSENSLCYSIEYAEKAAKFDPAWLKSYLLLSRAYYSRNENDNAIDAMLKYMSYAKGKDIKLAKAHLEELKFYTFDKVIQSSPSWNLLRFPDNAYVIDSDGAGHFTSLDQLIAKHGNSIAKASILVRPGVYIGTYSLEYSEIDIVGDCNVEFNPVSNVITKDPPVVFKNVKSPIFPTEAAHLLVKQFGDIPVQASTFSFNKSQIHMNRVTVEELIIAHPVQAVRSKDTNININQCSIKSKCSASVSTEGNCILSINSSIFIDVFGAVLVAGKNTTASLKHCIINNTEGIGVEARDNAKLELDSCKISNTKRQGLFVNNSAKRAKVTNCLFELNNIGKSIHEGAIQLRNCKAKIADTVIKKQKGGGIVIENGRGKFLELTIMNCVTAILVQAGVSIEACNVSHCVNGIVIGEVISDSVVLESNLITECASEVVRLPNSPRPTVKGESKHRIEEVDLSDIMLGTFCKAYKKAASKNASKGLNMGPVGDVLGINEERNPFFTPTSNLTCEHCGLSAVQIGGKLKKCGRCKIAVYCSENCQQKSWKTHKQMCEFYLKGYRAFKDEQHKK